MPRPRADFRFAAEATRLVYVWVGILLLGGIEFGMAFLPLGHVARPLVMIPAILMVVAVAVGFMSITKGPVIVRTFAVAAVFWLIVLLGLGSVDALTRTNYPVDTQQNAPP